MYRIGELAQRAGVSNDTLRYYEKNALLPPASRSDAGYRLYDSHALEQLRFIQRAKHVGFTLNDIRELLALKVEKDQHSCQEVKDHTEAKLLEVNAKIQELETIKKALQHLNDACCGGTERASHCSILSALETGSGLDDNTFNQESC